MHIKPVKIAALIPVGKPNDSSISLRYQGRMGSERCIPGRKIYLAAGPGLQLSGRIVSGIYMVYRMIKSCAISSTSVER